MSFSGDAAEDLFDALPDCTVKTARVTLEAHPDPERRVDLQIAVANLGLDILFSPDETLRGEPHWTTAQEIEEMMKVSAANRAVCLAAPPCNPTQQSLLSLAILLRTSNDGGRAPLGRRLLTTFFRSASSLGRPTAQRRSTWLFLSKCRPLQLLNGSVRCFVPS